jgi:hypothetical protein
MTYLDLRAALAREWQDMLLADAQAARAARRVGSPGARASMSADTYSTANLLSFRRIIDVPFETCMTVLESWERTAQDGVLPVGRSLLRWPIEHDRDCCAGRIEVALARGPLRSLLRMRLEINVWSRLSSRTALELIPCQHVRPTAAYFRSGHFLLDSLIHSLRGGGQTGSDTSLRARARTASVVIG